MLVLGLTGCGKRDSNKSNDTTSEDIQNLA